MNNPLIRKLAGFNGITDSDRELLERLCTRTRTMAAHQDIILHGDPPEDVHLVLEGIAIRYKLMPEGKRQIVALLLPGDFCDLHVAILGAMDHSMATLTPCTIVDISTAEIDDLTRNHPRITRAMWWATLVDEGTLRAWLSILGQLDADKRMAHLFCELLLRLHAVGLADNDSFDFPLTQADLGDILGLSAVHVNRTLQSLREANLVALKQRRLVIPHFARLRAFCSFDPTYLHLLPRDKRVLQTAST